MLRASVSLSRKVSHDFDSTGVGVTLDGEIPFGPDDAEGVLEKVQELYDLAREALSREVERQGGDHERPARNPSPPPPTRRNTTDGRQPPDDRTEPPPAGRPVPGTVAATPRQVQYVRNLAKRRGLDGGDLAAVVERVAGHPKKLTDLTRGEAGAVIGHLNALPPETTR